MVLVGDPTSSGTGFRFRYYLPMPSSSSAAPARQHPSLTLAVLCLSAFAYILLQSMVIPALPTIAGGLHTSVASVTWVLTAYLLSASIATPVLGRLGDMFGKKRVLVLVMVSLAIGSVIAALTTSLSVMIIARVIQGGGGAIFPLAFGIIRDEFPRHRVPGAIGLVSALIGIGAGIAIVASGPVVDALSFHWLFWIPAAMCVVAVVATIAWVPESQVTAPGRINLVSAAALSGWLVCLLLGVSKGSAWGWGSSRVLGLIALAVVVFVIWLASELRSREPLVDIRMMRIPTVWWTNLTALLIGFAMYSVMVVVPAFLQTPTSAGYGFGATTTRSGFAILPMAFAMLVAGILSGRMTSRFGAKVPLLVGSVIAALGLVFLAVEHAAEWDFYLAMALAGLGVGLAFAAMSNLVVEAVPPTQTGVATGMNANVRTIGGSIGSQVVASLIAASVATTGIPLERGYIVALIVLAGAFVLAIGAAALIPGRVGHAHAPVALAMETGGD
jgi:EmrB/QacA subfamily drug resistance transporter